MSFSSYRLDYPACRDLLVKRLAEPPPGRIQLLSGPRQVGKTTLLLELASRIGPSAIYAAADAPEASLPGFWDRVFTRAEEVASMEGKSVVLLDEAHLLHDWARQLKGVWDGYRRKQKAVHIVATGSSALHLTAGSRESLAGRFESMTLTHWSASALAQAFSLDPKEAAQITVTLGTYPGAFGLHKDVGRYTAYIRDAIVEPAIGRDLVALRSVRRPALLRQVFAVAASSPAQIISLQKMQGQLQDAGALETMAHYLTLLEDAFLVAALPKFTSRPARQRAAPPKLITLNSALLAAVDPRGIPDPKLEPQRFGAWVENACLAHAWNSGQRVSYWREEPLEVDGIVQGSWGHWAIEVKTGKVHTIDLKALFDFTQRYPALKPLLVGEASGRSVAENAGIEFTTWQNFLLSGPPRSRA